MTNFYDLNSTNRIVIKIGSSLLVDNASGPRMTWLNSLADDIANLLSANKSVIIVSSGAIALGKSILKLNDRKLRLDQKQAAAAVGQIELGRLFREVFNQRQLNCAQILLNFDNTEKRRQYLNARDTINRLIDFGVVPIVNENDTVATTEIRYGDNDRLSARVASMCSADLLVIFSDVDGLFTGPPEDPESQFVSEVEKIGPAIESMAGKSESDMGTGGMITKIQAARIATQSGTQVVITNGTHLNPIAQFVSGGRRTEFPAKDNPRSARKKWIAADLSPSGKIYIDDGAVAAIQGGGSLLNVGVVHIEGDFERGDILEIASESDVVVGRGISNYDRNDAMTLKGHQADNIEPLLGYRGPENLIHRDDMVLFYDQGDANEF